MLFDEFQRGAGQERVILGELVVERLGRFRHLVEQRPRPGLRARPGCMPSRSALPPSVARTPAFFEEIEESLIPTSSRTFCVRCMCRSRSWANRCGLHSHLNRRIVLVCTSNPRARPSVSQHSVLRLFVSEGVCGVGDTALDVRGVVGLGPHDQ